ncbi:unnamed protein product [Fraxinus pennsylvanica]|uniref:Uncharacterized protein n=1 Tax=Fraxinus pennsylvanica TaxID=56036 RepID=A0AAD1Z632_9LAMI|nr:unnamed protein product [Fraxinus pennsylvanica]
MCRITTQLACHAAELNEGYQLYIKAIEEVHEQIYRVAIGTKFPVETSPNQLDSCNEERSQFVLSDPNVSVTKGRKNDEKSKGKDHLTSGRFKSSIEVAQKNKKRYCALCKESSHDKRICPKYPKKNVNGHTEQMD